MDVKLSSKLVMSKLVFAVVLCPVLRIKSSFFNVEELQNSKFGVEISSEPVLLNQDMDGNTMQVTSKHGQQYQCVLPILHFESKENTLTNISKEEMNALLEPFNNTCLYLLEGWWTYKVCFGKSVYQYHEDAGRVTANISLGHYAGDKDWTQVAIKKSKAEKKRYHSQYHTNGTLCDLTGELRKAEIRFFCDPQAADYISRIDESSTCVYVITVHSNELCDHSLFRPTETPRRHSVICSPALSEDQFKKYTETKGQTKKDDTSTNGFSSSETKLGQEEVTEEKPRKRTPSIFEALARIFGKGVEKTNERAATTTGASKNDDDEAVDWEDVFKTSRSAIDKSVERIRKLQLHKKLEYEKGGMEEDTSSETSEMETTSTVGEQATSNTHLYNAEKDAESKESDYYQELIEGLKIQYRFFREQMDIVTKDMHEKIKRLENDASAMDPVVAKLLERIKATLRRFEENQRSVDDEMKRLTDLSEAVMEDPNYLKVNEEIAGIRLRLTNLMKKLMSKTSSSSADDDKQHDEKRSADHAVKIIKDVDDIDTEKGNIKEPKRKVRPFDMESPKLDKVVSKLKKIMTREVDENRQEDGPAEGDRLDDDRISVRVMKIKDKEEDLYDESDASLYSDDDDGDGKENEGMSGNDEMKAATKKMESMVRKQLQESGIQHEGKVKVKIITSKDALKRVAGGHNGFQILTPDETDEFRDLLTNLLGGGRDVMKEKERQAKLEDNYSLVWNRDGFASAKKHSSTNEDDSGDKNR